MQNTNETPALTPAQVLEIANAAGMGLDTLETRKMDDLDFHEVAVWNIEKAIKAAYEAGQKSTTNETPALNPQRNTEMINTIKPIKAHTLYFDSRIAKLEKRIPELKKVIEAIKSVGHDASRYEGKLEKATSDMKSYTMLKHGIEAMAKKGIRI
jgi:cell division protein FtsL